MVTNVTSLTGNGLKDWLIQRISALYLTCYSIFLFFFFLYHSNLNYEKWHALFVHPMFALASILGLLMLSLHAWIGLWTVATDYLTCTVLRLSVQLSVALWLLSQFIWGLMILWGQ